MSSQIDYAELEDKALVARAKSGDADAYEELVFRHGSKIYARAFSMMRNEEDARDLSQGAWVKGWQRLHQFHGDSSFSTWMTRVVINLCLDELRKMKRRRTESMDQLADENGGVERQLPVETVNPTERLERHELRERIDEAMEKLSDNHRTVIILHEFEGLEYKKIAEIMKCSIGTVMSRLFYARKKMATLLAGLKQEQAK